MNIHEEFKKSCIKQSNKSALKILFQYSGQHNGYNTNANIRIDSDNSIK